MVTTLCYKVIDLSPHDDASPASMEDILNHQAEEGWELVTGFERTHDSPPGGLHDRACPGPRQHGAGVQTG